MSGDRGRTLLIIVVVFSIQFVGIVSFLSYRSWLNSSVECVRCHGDRERLARLGYPRMYTTPQMVHKESGHANVECRDCHLGNGRTRDKETAHKGMLKALFVGFDGRTIERKSIFRDSLLPTGDNRLYELLPKERDGGALFMLSDVSNVLWHDRDVNTLNFDPNIAKKTCGKSNCHPKELEQFKTTTMGVNFRQRTMRTWTEPYGPHNCGPSFADLPPLKELKGAGFSYENTAKIRDDLNIPFTKGEAETKQRFCNICHAGCLDCHYAPDSKKGVHSFIKTPTAESCSGMGRGSNICHPGAMQSRRGETYIGGNYSIPEGAEPDVHYKKGINCVDCHQLGPKGMGDMERKAGCQDCHLDLFDAHKRGVHKNLDCAACHISELRGYQITVWGPGIIGGRYNPFKKYSLYYGIQKPPIIMKDREGVWRPFKIWPHAVGNIRNNVPPSPSLQYRWKNDETRDAYYVIGTVDGLPADNKQLLWLEVEQASHPYGRARDCKSCHERESQQTVSTWEFLDDYGADPFTGGYKMVADERGLRIEDMRNTSPITPINGSKLADFASWLYMKDRWAMPGNFAIKVDKDKYRVILKDSEAVSAEIDKLDKHFGQNRPRAYKEIRESALHDIDHGTKVLFDFTKGVKGESPLQGVKGARPLTGL